MEFQKHVAVNKTVRRVKNPLVCGKEQHASKNPDKSQEFFSTVLNGTSSRGGVECMWCHLLRERDIERESKLQTLMSHLLCTLSLLFNNTISLGFLH